MKIHVYPKAENKPPHVMENVAHIEEQSTFYIVHIRGEKWFEQILISKSDYTVFIEQ